MGRFDLARERFLPPLAVGTPESRSGVWDVWPAAGEVYFTTFFEEAGAVDPATGRVRRFALGSGLNELADGPEGTVLATRYGGEPPRGGDGEVIAVARDGALARRWPLEAPAGYRVAPKTAAWDPLRRALWVTTDLLPRAESAPERHDAYVVDTESGRALRILRPEVQLVARGPDGLLYRAEVDGALLQLRVVTPTGVEPPRPIQLDPAFPAALDFVQDIQPAADGRVVVTRWSGRVHVLQSDGTPRTLQLPRLEEGGLYYTAVVRGGRLCATYCAGVTVVCTDAP